MGIADWPEEQRPRERLIRDGARALSDAELLAIFLRVGTRGKNAIELAGEMVRHFGSLHGLFRATLPEFSAIPGLGAAKYAQLQAVLELARRAIGEELQSGQAFTSPGAVKEYLQLAMAGRPYESFHVLFLDVRNRLIEARELFRGTLTHASVYPREVVREALARNAAAVMLAHNHPSGNPEPSESDLLLTRSLVQALALVDIRVGIDAVLADMRARGEKV
ncbi:RadC family protein [Pseudoduganella sp. RAF53_2]|uniref:RadC family protein n=1 Tax=Pseudoduganella sp. RAF53_2 TaxID=3233060 RepID=UPI003F96E479